MTSADHMQLIVFRGVPLGSFTTPSLVSDVDVVSEYVSQIKNSMTDLDWMTTV